VLREQCGREGGPNKGEATRGKKGQVFRAALAACRTVLASNLGSNEQRCGLLPCSSRAAFFQSGQPLRLRLMFIRAPPPGAEDWDGKGGCVTA